MATRDTTPKPNPWNESTPVEPTDPKHIATLKKPLKDYTPDIEYDLEGLMSDFPTAKDLERFVFDETGIVLNLKGRANKLKYQVAMDTLNGQTPDAAFLGGENPYVDKTEIVPFDPMAPIPPRDTSLPDPAELQNSFLCRTIPHPDPDYRARGRKVECLFRKYKNGMISYEILGPVEIRAVGEKMDKFGRMRPEIIRWVDPRTGEQVIQRADGTLTPSGRRIRALMQTFRVNDSNQWSVWIDRLCVPGK